MKFAVNENNIPLQKIEEGFLSKKNIQLYILREDLIHPEISGNKWRKLKYNLIEAKSKGFNQILTFGGAFSNHIAATAAAGRELDFKTIGVIRGEETLPLNSTLQLAKDNGMVFKYISREQYRGNKKYEESFLEELEKEFDQFYLVPEGGSNALAVKGCTEIIKNIDVNYDTICVGCGTGGTIAGIIASTDNPKQILGFPALKGGDFLKEDIEELITNYEIELNKQAKNTNYQLICDYHFGGFAKVKPNLIGFIRDFKTRHNIILDFIYTGKMLFGLYDMFQTSNDWNNKTIIVVHTGGLQGNKGFEERLGIVL